MQAGSAGARQSRVEQLRARKQRADEGVEMFLSVDAAWNHGFQILLTSGNTRGFRESEDWESFTAASVGKMEQAVGMIREALPYRPTEMGMALVSLGRILHERGYKQRALAVLIEGIRFLKAHPKPGDIDWGVAMLSANTLLGQELWASGLLEEAAAAFEEGLEAQRAGCPRLPDQSAAVSLLQLYVDLGWYQKAIELGLATEPLLKPPQDVRGHGEEGRVAMLAFLEPLFRSELYATLADAYEAKSNNKECARYHNLVLGQREDGEVLDSCRSPTLTALTSIQVRVAKQMRREGDLQGEEEALDLILDYYLLSMTDAFGLGNVNQRYKKRVPPLRRLVEVKRALGKEAKARALELDLDETEAIFDSLTASALHELREELRNELQAEATGAAVDGAGGGKKKKKLTRKQQKRKAAQRRKAVAEQKEEEEGSAGVEGLAAAAAQLSIEEQQEPAPEPEPQAEEPEECAICLGDLDEGATLLACAHTFHAGCLARWKDKCMEKGLPYTCAMCRKLVVAAGAGAETGAAET